MQPLPPCMALLPTLKGLISSTSRTRVWHPTLHNVSNILCGQPPPCASKISNQDRGSASLATAAGNGQPGQRKHRERPRAMSLPKIAAGSAGPLKELNKVASRLKFTAPNMQDSGSSTSKNIHMTLIKGGHHMSICSSLITPVKSESTIASVRMTGSNAEKRSFDAARTCLHRKHKAEQISLANSQMQKSMSSLV